MQAAAGAKREKQAGILGARKGRMRLQKHIPKGDGDRALMRGCDAIKKAGKCPLFKGIILR